VQGDEKVFMPLGAHPFSAKFGWPINSAFRGN
jgi:hypothetical protein